MTFREFISNQWPFSRFVSQPRRRRSFKAAKVDRLSFGLQTQPKSLDEDLYSQLPVLTARARDLAKNDDYVRKYLRVGKNNIVGQNGIELRAQYTAGPNNDRPNKAASDAVESAWQEWGESPEVRGEMTWVDCQNLAVEHLARDGEILIRKQPRGPFGFQIQFEDPMSLAHRLNKILNRDREIIMGVEVDRRFRFVTAYYLHTKDTTQPAVFTFDSQKFVRIPADQVIHIFRREEVYQTRGFSPLASAIHRLNMLNGYEDAALTAARAGAAKMGFYTRTGDQPFEGEDEDSEENLIEDFEPGVMGILPMGYDVKSFDTNWPNVDHKDYLKTILRGVASGVGVSYNTLANDLEGVNFSSMRSGALEDRDEWKSQHRFFAQRLHQPVFEEFLRSSLTLRLIQNKSQPFGPDRFKQFRRVSWRGRAWPWVDPLKDIQANQIAIDYNIRSISDVIRENGRDPEEVFAEIQREQETMSELGIEVVRNGNNSSPAEAGNTESE